LIDTIFVYGLECSVINIDFLVAGCNTRCLHCYVNGGPALLMPIEDVLLCIEKLETLAQYFLNDTTFTLDHEPTNHPEIIRILQAASQTRYIKNYHHGMTTGVGLMRRQDKDAVIKAYYDCGYDTFGITIHGNAPHHDEIVRRKGAYDTTVAAATYLKSSGANIEVSLMLNRFFAEDASSISAMLQQLEPNYIGFVSPIFTPHVHMKDFEPYRASMETVSAIRGYLSEWKQDEEAILKAAEQNTIEGAVKRLIAGVDLSRLFDLEQDELYLTLHPDCQLYVGNSGAETQCLGDLRHIDLEETASIIKALPGNRDYGAFYDPAILPSTDALTVALEELPQNLIYGDFESVIYRGLTELGVPTKILALNKCLQ